MSARDASEPLLLGLDIGGTKIGACVGDEHGRVLASSRFETGPDAEPGASLARAKSELDLLLERVRGAGAGAEPAAIGAAVPGPFSYAERRFLDPPNMPRWHRFALGEWLESNFGCPSACMNDANASALAEWQWGAAKGATTAVYLTMSTGMGAGLIVDGRLYEGPRGLAGEIGRIRLRDDGPVGFAKRGSVEGFLSGPGMAQLAEQERLICVQRGEETALAAISPVTAEALCEASARGDAPARRVTDRVALELGRLCAILNDVLDPQVIVLGTIGSAHPGLFIPIAERVMREEGVGQSAMSTRIVASGLADRGNQAALAVAESVSRL